MALTNIPGAFASLSSGLLARKGAAKPAMRPQGFGQMGASLEDLGWNDMGFEAPKPSVGAERDATHDAFGDAIAEQPLRNPLAALTPSPVHGQQAEIAQRLAKVSDEVEEETAEQADVAPPPVAAATHRPPLQDAVVDVPQPEIARAPVTSVKPKAVDTPVAEVPALTIPARVPAARPDTASGPKAAFTLRLDAARHLRLRLACALTGRSAQMLVTEAVDRLLTDYPELETFAGQLPEGGRSRRVKGSSHA